ncbi:MAG: D-alanyl-D-alanine carboxypeptidase/D-alanyl-D-alanine-endopeptidase [Bacteroidota bacterium]
MSHPAPPPLFLAVFLLLSVCLAAAGQPRAPQTFRAQTDLSRAIEAVVSRPAVEHALWGVYVEELSTGRVRYARAADIPLIPASNAKLLSTAAVLDAYGPDFRFETDLVFAGDTLRPGVLSGDLIIRGSGDPTFGSRLGDTDPLRTWANALAASGVRELRGRIVGDDDVQEDALHPSSWEVGHVSLQSFAPAQSGLTYRDNTVQLVVTGGRRSGRAPSLRVEPYPYVAVTNEATVSRRRRARVRVARESRTDQLVLSGAVPRRRTRRLTVPVGNPTHYAAEALRTYLEAAGVRVRAQAYDVDELPAPPMYAGSSVLYRHISPRLADIVQTINRDSNNLFAEQLYRSAGWAGSTAGGQQRVRRLLERAGATRTPASVRDGSGLSRRNLVSARTLGNLLGYMDQHPHGDSFRESLATPSAGTLRGRLRRVDVRAKTGSLQGVRALSGYVTASDGTRYAFAVLANNYTGRSRYIEQAIDDIVRAVAK